MNKGKRLSTKTYFVAIGILMLILLVVAAALAEQPAHIPEENNNHESELEEKTDSGTFIRLIGTDQVEIRISGVPEDIPPKVFHLYEDITVDFNSGDQVRFNYSKNISGEDIITDITKITN